MNDTSVISPDATAEGHSAPPSVRQRRESIARVLVIFGAIPLWGAERANIKVMETVAAAGVESRFITHGQYGHQSVQPALDCAGLNWTTAPFGPNLTKGLGWRGWIRVVRGLVETNRVVWRELRTYRPTHLYAMNPAYLFYAWPIAICCGLPLIYRAGDAPPTHHYAWRMLWRLISHRTTVLVANSEFIRRKCLAAGVPAEKLRRIYSTAPKGPARPEAAEVELHITQYLPEGPRHEKLTVRRAAGVLTLLFCGQLNAAKGADLLVRVVLKLLMEGTRLRLLMAGDYSWENPFAEALRRQVQATGQQDHVCFLGYVQNMPDLWALADVHVCPSCWEEPLSNTVLEAKRAGVPSIIFPMGGLPETIEHGVNGWCCPTPTEVELERALRFYLGTPGEAVRQGAAARRSAEADFGEERFRREWTEVFRSTLPVNIAGLNAS